MLRVFRKFRSGLKLYRQWCGGWLATHKLVALAALAVFVVIMSISVFHATHSGASFTCTTGGDHAGAAWDLSTCPGLVIAGVHTNVGAVTLPSGQTVTVQTYNGTSFGSVDITATSISISGTLTAAAAGYPGGTGSANGSGPGGGTGTATANGAGGGGYGGNGQSSFVVGGSANGSALNPVSLGSGGGAQNGSVGGNGGGAIKLTASGTITVSGTIASNGGAGTGTNAGAGSGGSIFLTAATITGAGSITANGGNGPNSGGGGSGGRIKLTYSTSYGYTGSLSATAGSAFNFAGAVSGTLVVYDSTNNDLYINASQTWYANPSIDGSSFSFRNVNVAAGVGWTLMGYNTTNSDGVGQTFNVTNFTVGSGAVISASGGYPGGTGSGAGAGPGGGGGISGASSGGGGGGYGGKGQTSFALGGSANGSALNPISLGSGGGAEDGFSGGAGGGAIKVAASGTITVTGTISSVGGTGSGSNGSSGNGGAGSGGSIFLSAATITGAGALNANGGNGPNNGGGGSGGRIKLAYSSANTYSGSISVTGGSAFNFAGAANGTIVYYDSTNNDLTINQSQTWYASPSIDGSTFNFHAVTIQNNSTLTLMGYNTTNSDGIGQTFNVTNFTIASGATLSGNAGGYPGGVGNANGSGPGGGAGNANFAAGGGGYGSSGGNGNGLAGGPVYGAALNPIALGSGGGSEGGTNGGAGGGAIKIVASGTVTVTGNITCNGGTPSVSASAGGGAGGSVYIAAGTITGAGSITANGFNGANGGGGGAGGRILVSYNVANTYTGSKTALPGTVAGTGTIVTIDAGNNDLFIGNSQTWYANPSMDGSAFTYHAITVQNNSTWTLVGYNTTNSNGVGFTFTTVNFTISTGSTLTSSGGGYPGGTSSGNGSGPGGGTGTATANGAGGGAYGGSGGNGNAGVAGSTARYGLANQPQSPGSGGGAQTTSAGGAGGGAVQINANGTATISGAITCSGANGTANGAAGGSGGSIFIIAGTITGSAALTANGGTATTGGGGGGGRITVVYGTSYAYTGTATANGGTGANAGTAGTVTILHHALLDRAITMSSSAPSATSVSYEVVFKPAATTTVGGIVVDICDDSPIFGAATCTYPSGFNWGGASPSVTVNGGMGAGWTASGVQGGAGAGVSQVLKLSNATPQSVSTSTNIDFTVTSVTNPSTSNHTFFARVITFNTSGNMNAEYTISGTTRSGALQDSLDNGGFALSTSQAISLTFRVPESLSFCVSAASIGANCSGVTPPNITLGHTVGSSTLLDGSQVDKTTIFAQTSTNARLGVTVRIRNTNAGATCGGLSVNNGVSCGIPAVNVSCAGSCSATTITAGTAAVGLCVLAGSGNTTPIAPYNGVNCGTTGTTYGLDDATANGVRSTYGSAIFSSTGPINQENDSLTFAATASSTAPAGTYAGSYSLIATSTF